MRGINMVLDREGLLLLLTALWGKNYNYKNFDIYEMFYDLMTNGTENGMEYTTSDFDKIVDEVMDRFGTVSTDEAEPMTLEEIEAELGRKIRIV